MSIARFCSCTVGSSQALNCTESTLCKQDVLMESGCCNWHVPPDQTAPRPFITPLSTYMRLCPGGRCCQVTPRIRTKCYRSPGTHRPFSSSAPWGWGGGWGRYSGERRWCELCKWSVQFNIFSHLLIMRRIKNPRTKPARSGVILYKGPSKGLQDKRDGRSEKCFFWYQRPIKNKRFKTFTYIYCDF